MVRIEVSTPDHVEPGNDHEIVAVPGDMPAMNESRRYTGSLSRTLIEFR
jgi:hypothetical protein